jgi:hypothetical protein
MTKPMTDGRMVDLESIASECERWIAGGEYLGKRPRIGTCARAVVKYAKQLAIQRSFLRHLAEYETKEELDARCGDDGHAIDDHYVLDDLIRQARGLIGSQSPDSEDSSVPLDLRTWVVIFSAEQMRQINQFVDRCARLGRSASRQLANEMAKRRREGGE